MRRYRNAVLYGFLAAAATFVTPATAQNAYPNRPITFVVSFAPGGLSDVAARLIGAEMSKHLGQSIVIENRPGASGITGGTYAWRAAPDGYTVLASAISEVQNLHYLDVPYKFTKDFMPIGKVADGPSVVLIVKSDSQFKTFKDLITFAKTADKVNFATSGPATSPAIAIAQLNSLAKTKIVGIAYRGSGPAAAAVVSGDVHAAFTYYSIAKPLAENNQVRILAVASKKRLDSAKDVPTMAELGYPGFEHDAFVGLSAPPNTPKEIIAVLNKALNESVRSPEFKAKITNLGMQPPPANNTPEAFHDFLVKETARQAALAKLTGNVLNKKSH